MRKVYACVLGVIFVLVFVFGGTTAYAEDPVMDDRRAECEDKEPGDTCEFRDTQGFCTLGYGMGVSNPACTGDPDGLEQFFDEADSANNRRQRIRQYVEQRNECTEQGNIGEECSFQSWRGDELSGTCARGDGDYVEGVRAGMLGEGRLFCNETVDSEEGWGRCEDYSQAGDRCYSFEDDEVGRCESDGEESLTCNTEYGDREPGDTYTECGDKQCADSKACVENDDGDLQCRPTSSNCGGCEDGEVCVENDDDDGICRPEAGEEKTVPEIPGGGGDDDNGFTRPEPEDITFRNPIAFETIPELLAGLIRSALGLLAAVTTVILVISGFKYMVAGSPSGVQSALGGIKNAVIGLVIIMGSFLLTEYVISALLS